MSDNAEPLASVAAGVFRVRSAQPFAAGATALTGRGLSSNVKPHEKLREFSYKQRRKWRTDAENSVRQTAKRKRADGKRAFRSARLRFAPEQISFAQVGPARLPAVAPRSNIFRVWPNPSLKRTARTGEHIDPGLARRCRLTPTLDPQSATWRIA